jgi:hypothetical protein
VLDFFALVVLNNAERYLWLGLTLIQLALLIRMWRAGLFPTYRRFGVFLVYTVATSAVMYYVPFQSEAYRWSFIWLTPIQSVILALIVFEIFHLAFRDYKGLHQTSHIALYAGFAIAAIVSTVSLAADLASPDDEMPYLLAAFVARRAVASVLLIALLVLGLFINWFPVPLTRNLLTHMIVFATYLTATSVLMLVRNVIGAEMTRILSTASQAVEVLCFLAWVALLTKHGEQKRRSYSGWKRADPVKMSRQLDELNEALMRTARNR